MDGVSSYEGVPSIARLGMGEFHLPGGRVWERFFSYEGGSSGGEVGDGRERFLLYLLGRGNIPHQMIGGKSEGSSICWRGE